ncbi:RHS repeat-associated core domain-containing protein [Pedobacter steynii]|uniref:RHS repeat-associated core domain-containing protein n=2 Tax=Pedobacter steynii TaxID=430522 RepID=A0A1G9J1S9_9SPHI|nr:RHS repeat-associated core domain-containing protein [Pedobacter steynii]
MENRKNQITTYFIGLISMFTYVNVNAQEEQDRTVNIYNNETEITAKGSITLKDGFYIPAGKTVRIYTTGLSFEKYVPVLNSVSVNQNYILTRTFKRPGIFTDTDIAAGGRNTSEVNQTVQYFDGLGRSLQAITIQGSPGFRDMVQPVVYDAFGREAVKYQSYAEVSNGGGYRADALTPGAGQASFFSGTTGIKATTKPFSVMVFEASPLNRVLEQGAPGDAWQPASSRTATTGRTVVSEYGTNLAEEPVKLWTVTSSGASSAANYATGRLYKTKIKDENWVSGNAGTVDEYKDFDDHVVLKRVWETDTKSLSTYYVYDDFGDLRYVLPPGVNENGSDTNSFMESDTVFKNFIYGYHYDDRRRLIEKQIPGKGWEYMVYNVLDQIVLSQDSVQRGSGKWNYSKYDAFARVVTTGLYTSSLARSAMQTEVSTDGITNILWESRPDAVGSDYTNVAFPRVSTEAQVISYYDNYSFVGNTFGAPTGEQMPADRTKTLLTGTKVNILGTTTMLLTVNYYDDESRVVQSKSQNHLNGTDVVENTYDFIGQLKASTRTHVGNGATTTIARRYDLDHMGRKLATWESINGAAEIALNRMYYNELGQLFKKSVHSADTTNFLQSGTYAYNEKGWTKTYSSPQFSYDLKYQDGTTPQFNGNIANQFWGSNTSYPNVFTYGYDHLNRLLSGTSTGTVMSELLTYDEIGNIVSLNRDGALGSYTYTGNKLNQVTGGLATGVYSYDANGNAKVDGRTGVTLTYNQLNLPAAVSKIGLTMAYTYDATGAKLRKTSNGATRDYAKGIEYDGANIDIIHNEEGLARRNGSVYSYEYNLTDHLGNVRLSFYKNPSAALEVLQQTNYYPFGKTLVAKDGPNKYLYNGKELQEELGQLDYGARFYDPVVGRWNVVDPLAEKGRRWSPYTYTFNNPIRFTDPDGMWPDGPGDEDDDGIPIGLQTGMAIGGAIRQGWNSLKTLVANAGDAVGINKTASGKKWQAVDQYSKESDSYNSVMVQVPREGAVKDALGHLGDGVNAVALYASLTKGTTNTLLAKTGKEASAASSMNKAISSLKQNISEHTQKLKEYKADPMKFDNKGTLKNAPEELRAKIIAGRVKHLEKEIQTFRENIEKIQNKKK